MIPQAQAGGTELSTSQVSVTSTAVLLAAANKGNRQHITIVNDGTTDVWIGNSSSVTTTTGVLLAGIKGQTLTLYTSDAVYGIVASTAQTVSVAIVQ